MMSKLSKSNLKKTLYYLKRNGLRDTYLAALERLRKKEEYIYEPLSEEQLAEQKERSAEFSDILFSILVPVYNTPEAYLKRMIESVLAQTYGNFELILADAGTDAHIKEIVSTYQDERIRYIRLQKNAGISANTNEALAHARGMYTGLLDHDDILTPDALYENIKAISEAKKKGIYVRLLYSDEDKCNEEETAYTSCNKKPEFNLDLILSNNYICHFTVMETLLMKKLKFRPEYDGAQDYDLILRAVAAIYADREKKVFAPAIPGEIDPAKEICHIPRVLYHWRCHSASTADNPQSKQYAYEAGRNAVRDFLREQGIAMGVFHSRHLGFYEIRYFPDIFTVRPDAGAVGTAVYGKNNKITGGIYDADGHCPYEGLKRGYSGECNRAAMVQDAYTLDVRTMRVRKELTELVKETLKELAGNDNNGVLIHGYVLKEDGTLLSRENFTEDEYKRISESICRKLREQGYRLLFLPEGSGL